MTRSPTKDRVYLALRDGASIREAARKAKVHERTVREHAADLVRRGVLVRADGGPGKAVRFNRGPKAHPYESSIGNRVGSDRVGSAAGAPKVALRVHRGGYGFEVRGSLKAVPWSESWRASGVPNFALRDAAGNRFWVVQAKGAPARLMVQPTEEWVYDPAAVSGASEARRARVVELARSFVTLHGLKFVSERAYQFQPVEFAAEMPGLEKFGEPGASFVWVDGSPGDGRLEVETQDADMGRLLLEWPDLVRQLKEHEAALSQLTINEGLILRALAPVASGPPRRLPPEHDPGVA